MCYILYIIHFFYFKINSVFYQESIMKSQCSSCGIIEYGIETEEVPLCFNCKNKFAIRYNKVILYFDYNDPTRVSYIKAMLKQRDLKK